MFDNRKVSQERVIGISFVDILIQALFVLLVALLVGYMDPTERSALVVEGAFGGVGKDLCAKLNKDSLEACREYIKDKEFGIKNPTQAGYGAIGEDICQSFGASTPEECDKVIDRQLAPLRPCLNPVSEFVLQETVSFSVKSPSEIVFLGFSKAFIAKLSDSKQAATLSRVIELEQSKGTTYTPREVELTFDFIREKNCFHSVIAGRPGPFSDGDLREALGVMRKLRQPVK